MTGIGFYLLGQKGFDSLSVFLNHIGTASIAYVVVARDKGVEKDYADEISSLCKQAGVAVFERQDNDPKEVGIIADYCFAIGWRWIIGDVANLVVFHDSLLPKYRGFSPLVNMLINKEEKIGVTALLASDEYDTGDLVGQKEINIFYPIKIQQAIDIVSIQYGELLLEVASKIITNQGLNAQKQEDSEATYSLWRDETDYFLDWTLDAETLLRTCDALGYPYKGAAAYLNGKLVRLKAVTVCSDINIENRRSHIGKVVFFRDGYPVVVCGEGLLKIEALCDEFNNPLEVMKFRSRFTRGFDDRF